ncbi:MAG3090 family protein [Mycoplasma nasistruthionis]|uniref:Uncharacterized protein n=1 Tax=Mycoplasma nasistruthionis TaxID=353852 RepID=A0A4Y6I6F3_9MOLU|nr:hypothetical protein [Mycoplasma nasistruthionis]QDF64890.1 hypothetical protein FIV53_01000 [Mycoplasma nasistruthionis]
MKRLNCLYNAKKNKEYPWALKHPKVENALALFKSRKDAMNWFLAYQLDCAVWFQTDKRIVGGLLIGYKNSDDKMEYELNVDKFDGKLDYEETLKELNITKDGFRDEDGAKVAVEEVVDFKQLHDVETYFPLDDDYKYERKASAKDLEIEKLRAQISELSILLSQRTSGTDYSQELIYLTKQLEDSNSDKETLLRQIAELKEKLQQQETVVVEEKVVEVEPTVVVECDDKIKEYVYIRNLSACKQIKILAVYVKKLEKLSSKLASDLQTSVADLQAVDKNLRDALSVAQDLEVEYKDNDEKLRFLAAIMFSLKKSLRTLSEKVVGKAEIEDSAENALYFETCDKENVKVAQYTSFVAYDQMHVGFVPENDYLYAVYIGEPAARKHFVVLDSPFDAEQVVVSNEVREIEVIREVPVEIIKEVIKEVEVPVEVIKEVQVASDDKQVSAPARFSWLALFLLAVAYGILIALVVLFATGVISA